MSYKEKAMILFGDCSSFHEAAYDVTAEFSCKADALPRTDALIEFVSEIDDRDTLTLEMKSVEEFAYTSQDKAVWQQSYEKFVADCEQDDVIKITLHITKRFQGDTISIYCFDAFVEYLCNLNVSKQAKFFVALFNGRDAKSSHPQIRFDLRDTDSAVITKTMQFCREEIVVALETADRQTSQRKYSAGSLFFSQSEYDLTPDDFSVFSDQKDIEDEASGKAYEPESNCGAAGLLKTALSKLETILAYAYLAHTSQIVSDNIVLQFDASNPGFTFKLDSIAGNRSVCRIFDWAFHCDNVVERASIARNVIAIRCKSESDLMSLGDDVLNSVISNFNIYQKSSTEKYIETKNKIADLIVESTKQVQELTHDLVESLRNNFMAMAMFLLTTLLTDSIDVDDVIQGKPLSAELILVLDIFVAFSAAYLVVTYISAFFKWRMFIRGYNQLKKYYSGLLDGKDLEEAFANGDESVNKTRDSILIAGGIILVIWIGCLVWLYTNVHGINIAEQIRLLFSACSASSTEQLPQQ